MKLFVIMAATVVFLINFSYAQNVGIGTTTPVARLHVSDSNVVFTGPFPLPVSPGNPPVSNAGTRMMWYPGKAAFRAGYVSAVNWNKDSIGTFSFATGYNTKAKGTASISMGDATTASGDYSTSMGSGTIASGHYSTSMGIATTASGFNSSSMGWGTIASGNYSTSMGSFTMASGHTSTSMGWGTIAIGNNSTSMGFSTIAKTSNSLAIGIYNDTTNGDRLFEIGNGESHTNRSNAMTVLHNGNVGIGTTNPSNRLHISNANNSVRIEGPSASGTGGKALAIGGFGDVDVDAPGVIGGRLKIKENGNIGISTSNPLSTLHVNGFTRLGEQSTGIKIKRMGGFTPAIDGGTVTVVHGLAPEKILSVKMMIEYAPGFFVPDNYSANPGYQLQYSGQSNFITLINVAGTSGNILNKPVRIIITYEE
jgi:hypothetical protein